MIYYLTFFFSRNWAKIAARTCIFYQQCMQQNTLSSWSYLVWWSLLLCSLFFTHIYVFLFTARFSTRLWHWKQSEVFVTGHKKTHIYKVMRTEIHLVACCCCCCFSGVIAFVIVFHFTCAFYTHTHTHVFSKTTSSKHTNLQCTLKSVAVIRTLYKQTPLLQRSCSVPFCQTLLRWITPQECVTECIHVLLHSTELTIRAWWTNNKNKTHPKNQRPKHVL